MTFLQLMRLTNFFYLQTNTPAKLGVKSAWLQLSSLPELQALQNFYPAREHQRI
jgi:hypothetical protein